MLKFIAKRLGISVLVLLVGSLLLFVLVINSGDPLADLRESLDPNRENLIARRIEFMGLDLPWYERYFSWLFGVGKCLVPTLTCDLGSNVGGQAVTGLVAQAASSTLRLVVLATFLAIILGVVMGIVSAIRQYSAFDYGVTLMAFVFFSLPVFWAAVLLKHYAAIEFNNWLVEAAFSPWAIIVIAGIAGVVVQAAAGGGVKRRLISGGAIFVVLAAILFYFDWVTWFRRPAVGIPVYILAVLGAAVLILMMTSGLGNKRVRNTLGVTAIASIVGYLAMRPFLMSEGGTLILVICFAAAIAIGLLAGRLLGGFSYRQSMVAALWLAILASFIALADLLLSNWNAYIGQRPRPIPTVGAETPNFTTTYWGHFIDLLTHLFLPTVVLTLISLAAYTRYTRASMLEVMNQDYIRTARSKGISERKVITRHALRNSLIPLATIVAFDFAGLIGGAVITETVFGWQGMGKLFIDGVQAVDPPPVMAFFLVTATAAVVMNMLADIAYAFLDPRISR